MRARSSHGCLLLAALLVAPLGAQERERAQERADDVVVTKVREHRWGEDGVPELAVDHRGEARVDGLAVAADGVTALVVTGGRVLLLGADGKTGAVEGEGLGIVGAHHASGFLVQRGGSMWHVGTREPERRVGALPDDAPRSFASPVTPRVLRPRAAGGNRHTLLDSLDGGEPIRLRKPQGGPWVGTATWSRDGRRFAVAWGVVHSFRYHCAGIEVYDHEGRSLRRFEVPVVPPTALSFSHDGEHLTWVQQHAVRVEIETGKELARVDLAPVLRPDFLPVLVPLRHEWPELRLWRELDDRYALSVDNAAIRIWHVDGLRQARTIELPGEPFVKELAAGPALAAAFDAGGSVLAVATVDALILYRVAL